MLKVFREIIIVSMISVLLLNSHLQYSAQAQDPDDRNTVSSLNPRENAILLKSEMEEFKLQVLPLLENKSVEEATEIFFEHAQAFYEMVGLPFKWRYIDFYEFKMDWENHGVAWPQNPYIIQGIPNDNEITEEEVIDIAERIVRLLSGIPDEELDMCWPDTSYHKTNINGNYSWYINFVVETPEKDAPYYVKFALEIDAITGTVYSYFDSQSNDI